MSVAQQRRSIGFTLVELLVVIAIIGILIALLLPAVQAAREAARRSQCLNNIKQIGVAVHNFHGALKQLPDSHSYHKHDPHNASYDDKLSSRGWLTVMLPFMEQQAIYDIMEPYFDGDFGKGEGINHPNLANVVNRPIPGLRCPSDAGGGELVSTQQWQWVGREIALTNYKGIIGNNKMGNVGVGTPDCHRDPDCNGLFWRFSHKRDLRFKDITDGQSNTFLVGEDLPRHNYHSALYHGNGDYSSTHFPLNVKPNPPIPKDWPLTMTFRSDHPGGANFGLVDGSVRFIPDGIDFDTYRFLSTRNGEEVIPEF